MSAFDSQTAWVIGSSDRDFGADTVLRTVDGGATWSRTTIEAGGVAALYLAWIDVVDNTTIVASGYLAAVGTAFLQSLDGGASWAAIVRPGVSWGVAPGPIAIGTDRSYWQQVNWGCGPGTICGMVYVSSDGGITWLSTPIGAGGTRWGVGPPIFSLAARDQNTAFGIAGGDVYNPGNTIVATTDGGQTWKILLSGGQADDARSLIATASASLWLVGRNGLILRTQDAGATWIAQSSGTTSTIDAISAVRTDPSTAWAVGANGLILKTTSGGN
jgi:photosystem II stability/assembly factor-like uncharacterized protein